MTRGLSRNSAVVLQSTARIVLSCLLITQGKVCTEVAEGAGNLGESHYLDLRLQRCIRLGNTVYLSLCTVRIRETFCTYFFTCVRHHMRRSGTYIHEVLASVKLKD